jgi:predicted nucleotidyltransferase
VSENLFSLIVLFSALGFLAGATIGFILSNANLRRALHATYQAILRRTIKKRSRVNWSEQLSIVQEQGNNARQEVPSLQSADKHAIKAVRSFRDALDSGFGDRIISVYLFGSRARGDFMNTSDADIAVMFSANTHIGIYTQLRLEWAAFKVMLSHGLYLQVRALQEGSTLNCHLLPVIAQEGLQV